MLRGMMDRCEALADELASGRCGPEQLTREVMRLRLAFEAHNQFEEQMLRPVLLRGMPEGMLQRHLDAHVAEHRAMRSGLASDETAMLREVIAAMRMHLDVEEGYRASATQVRAALAE